MDVFGLRELSQTFETVDSSHLEVIARYEDLALLCILHVGEDGGAEHGRPEETIRDLDIPDKY